MTESEGRTRPCDVPGLGFWLEGRLEVSKVQIVEFNFDRESLRLLLTEHRFVNLLFLARSDREFRKYIKSILDYVTGYAPAGLARTVGFATIRRQSPRLSTLLLFDHEDAFEICKNYGSDEED